MQTEIEVKFLNVNHDEIREKLKLMGAKVKYPMRLMRRAMFDYPDRRFQKSNNFQRLRVRDEGDKVTITYKESQPDSSYDKEVETTVGSFENTRELLESIGLSVHSIQESKRETWHLGNVEIVLDEWPWIHPYIEIEGADEKSVKDIAEKLGFSWENAKHGTVDTIYRLQYLGMKEGESIGDITEVKFDSPLPKYLQQRLVK